MADVIDTLAIDIVANDSFTAVAKPFLALLERMEQELDSNAKALDEANKSVEGLSTTVAELNDATSEVSKSQDKHTKALEKNEKQSKKNEKAAKNLLDGVLGFGKALGAISTMIMAGIGLDRLVKQTSQANQELDSMAKNIGMSSRSLASWQGAAEAMGGSASGMANTLMGLSGALTRFQVMGDASVIPFFNALGVAPLDAMGNIRKLEEIMLELADKFSKMDRGTALVMAQGLGIDEETFNTLAQGKEAYQEMLAYQSKIYKSNQDDIETSKKLNKSVSMLNQQFDGLKLMIANAAAPALLTISELTTKFFEFLSRNENLVKGVFMGIAGAMTAVLIPTLLSGAKAALAFMAPFLPAILLVAALAGVFGLLYDDYKKWAEGGNSLFNWGAFIKWFDKANFSVRSLADGFIYLLTEYEDWNALAEDGKSWLKLKGFIDENGLSVGSLATGFKNLGKDIVEYLMPVFDRLLGILYKIITLDLEGAWNEVKSLGSDSVDWVTQKTKDAWGSFQGWLNGVEERAPEAFDKAAQIKSSDEDSLTQQSKSAGLVDSKKGFSKLGADVEKSVRDEMNKLGYSKQEQAMFLATVTHESSDFNRLREVGGYKSVEQMQKAGISRAKKAPEGAKRAIEQGVDAQFEFMYGGRMGNDQVGDGAKYRGRGAIQITGKDNYRRIGNMLGVDLVKNPELLEKDPVLAAKASIAWWENKKSESKSFKQAISAGDFEAVTRGVNNGLNGWEDRKKRYAMYSKDTIPSKRLIDLNQPIGGYMVATALNATQQARQTMQNLAQPQSINNNQRTEVVINGGVNVHSSASTITGTTQDAANGIKTSMSGLQFNTGLV
ncbi:peptidoglycan-binding protein LysM [Glaesserella parasuis]|nr:peptidoglycan-binding protein LysM [Glaesserella parasuis]